MFEKSGKQAAFRGVIKNWHLAMRLKIENEMQQKPYN